MSENHTLDLHCLLYLSELEDRITLWTYIVSCIFQGWLTENHTLDLHCILYLSGLVDRESHSGPTLSLLSFRAGSQRITLLTYIVSCIFQGWLSENHTLDLHCLLYISGLVARESHSGPTLSLVFFRAGCQRITLLTYILSCIFQGWLTENHTLDLHCFLYLSGLVDRESHSGPTLFLVSFRAGCQQITLWTYIVSCIFQSWFSENHTLDLHCLLYLPGLVDRRPHSACS